MSNFYDKETDVEIALVVRGCSHSQTAAYELAHKFQVAFNAFVQDGWMNTPEGGLEVSASQATYNEPQEQAQDA